MQRQIRNIEDKKTMERLENIQTGFQEILEKENNMRSLLFLLGNSKK